MDLIEYLTKQISLRTLLSVMSKIKPRFDYYFTKSDSVSITIMSFTYLTFTFTFVFSPWH